MKLLLTARLGILAAILILAFPVAVLLGVNTEFLRFLFGHTAVGFVSAYLIVSFMPFVRTIRDGRADPPNFFILSGYVVALVIVQSSLIRWANVIWDSPSWIVNWGISGYLAYIVTLTYMMKLWMLSELEEEKGTVRKVSYFTIGIACALIMFTLSLVYLTNQV